MWARRSAPPNSPRAVVLVSLMRFLAIAALVLSVHAQQPGPPAAAQPTAAAQPPAANPSEEVLKRIDNLMWHMTMDDVAVVDKSEFPSLPPVRIPNPRAPGAGNPLIIRAYTFIPKN